MIFSCISGSEFLIIGNSCLTQNKLSVYKSCLQYNNLFVKVEKASRVKLRRLP